MAPDKCQMYPNEIATVHVVYGLYSEYEKGNPHHEHNLCDKAAKELFDKCAILVNLGDMHWKNEPIKQNEDGTH